MRQSTVKEGNKGATWRSQLEVAGGGLGWGWGRLRLVRLPPRTSASPCYSSLSAGNTARPTHPPTNQPTNNPPSGIRRKNPVLNNIHYEDDESPAGDADVLEAILACRATVYANQYYPDGHPFDTATGAADVKEEWGLVALLFAVPFYDKLCFATRPDTCSGDCPHFCHWGKSLILSHPPPLISLSLSLSFSPSLSFSLLLFLSLSLSFSFSISLSLFLSVCEIAPSVRAHPQFTIYICSCIGRGRACQRACVPACLRACAPFRPRFGRGPRFCLRKSGGIDMR